MDRLAVAYITSHFPVVTETFILFEILELKKVGIPIEIFPLFSLKNEVVHPEANILSTSVHRSSLFSPSVLSSNLRLFARNPAKYVKLVAQILWGVRGSQRFFIAALATFPKVVHLAHQIASLRVTHIHAHFAHHPALAALIISRLTGIPFSFTAHGSDLHVDRQMLREKLEAAEFAVTISKYNRDLMVREYGDLAKNKVQVIHCGVDVDFFSPVVKEKIQKPVQLVCVARFEEVKGHSYLVEACRLLRSRGIDFRCHLIGRGPLQKDIEKRLRAYSLQDQFYLHGDLIRTRLATILQNADIAVLPSVLTRQGKREGIPVALMEAMACGLPVVASDISGVPELIESGKTGLLVEPGNPVAISKALEKLIRDCELRQNLAFAGRKKIAQEFNQKVSARQLLHLFPNPSSSEPPITRMIRFGTQVG